MPETILDCDEESNSDTVLGALQCAAMQGKSRVSSETELTSRIEAHSRSIDQAFGSSAAAEASLAFNCCVDAMFRRFTRLLHCCKSLEYRQGCAINWSTHPNVLAVGGVLCGYLDRYIGAFGAVS